MKKTLKCLMKVLLICFLVLGLLFAVYITNTDSKMIEFIYDKLAKYHESKKVEDRI